MDKSCEKTKYILLILALMIISCSQSHLKLEKKDTLTLWHHEDYVKDSIYGTSLEKWYEDNFRKVNNEIIVATLDTQIDLDHEDLQGQFWVNKNEVPNNGIDDDNNGYIDDVNGWNFVGKPNGGYFRYGNFEYTKVVRKYQESFKDKKEVPPDSVYLFNEFKRASKLHNAYSAFYENWLKSLKFSIDVWPIAKDSLRPYFPKEDYTISQLDSLYQKVKINDKTYIERRDDNDRDLGALIDNIIANLEIGNESIEDLIKSKYECDSTLNRKLNIEHDPRLYIKDNPNILEKGYGNNVLNNNTFQLGHHTATSSIIAANRKNKKQLNGFHDNIRIMPLVVSCSGDEYDKDITMAIRYAVDNGAKVINMSFGKQFSIDSEWIQEAFKYAEEHDVLLVHGSGNNKFNVDENPYYPSDYNYKEKREISDNFINVGSISKRTDSTIVSSFSNYGKNNVDLFAPGEGILVAAPNNEYKTDSGTSLAAPMVSGTAALIWLYYPNLTVQEVKNIILESGVTIDEKVIKPGTKNEMVHFSELCKTGRVLNTYNAMKMAAEVSKKKK